jgi:hypothetical protein
MAIVANTYLRYDAKGLRESLHDFIYDVSPEDTPFLSAAGRGDAVQTLEEWQTDALASADTANAQLEGDDVSSFSAITPTARVGNYTQISRKTFLISETEEVVDKAGRRSEMAYQVPRRGVELKIDIESICFQNIAGVAGDSTTARKAAGLDRFPDASCLHGDDPEGRRALHVPERSEPSLSVRRPREQAAGVRVQRNRDS